MSASYDLLAPVLLPGAAAAVAFLLPRSAGRLAAGLGLCTALAQLAVAALLVGPERALFVPWVGYGVDFTLRIDAFSAFVLVATAGFGVLIELYALASMRGHPHEGQFHAWVLVNLCLTSGAMLADNLVAMLFFWEGLLCALFGMIAIGRPGAWRTSVKALVLVGISDLCLMLGIGIAGHLAGTLEIAEIAAAPLPTEGLGGVAFVLLATGAVSKAGSLPFHSWIPDAALDAPLPFMALVPAALEKLLGIYFLGRVCLDLFDARPGAWASTLLMAVGAVTILVAVAMALVQKDYKRLLSYHAISQVGYMILGIGTAVPAGIVGGLFHMVNHAMYKSCLFLTAGSVEKQAGTTDLRKLGGIGRAMPVTFASFTVAALAISGVPPLNGFFSKELVYEGALERHWGWYAAALLGSFLTGASFLKLGHAAFLGPRREGAATPREAPWAMWLPMLALVTGCLLFGLYNPLPLRGFVQPAVGAHLEGHDFAGLPHSLLLVGLTCAVIALAVAHHLLGVRLSGSGLGAADHIHHAPVLGAIYEKAQRRWFDPYDLGVALLTGFAWVAFAIDRAIDWTYDVASVETVRAASRGLREAHDGNPALYVAYTLGGLALVGLVVASSM